MMPMTDHLSAPEIIESLRWFRSYYPKWGDLDPCRTLEEAAGMIEKLSAELEQARRERNGALTDLWNMGSCKKCLYAGDTGEKCNDCWLRAVPGRPELTHRTNWEWRGPCAENGWGADPAIRSGGNSDA